MHSELMPLAFRLHSWMHSAFITSFVENPLQSALQIHIVLHSGCTQDSSLCIQDVWMSKSIESIAGSIQNACHIAYRIHVTIQSEDMPTSTRVPARMQSEAMPECIQNVGRAALRMHLGMHSEIPAQMHSAIHVTIQSQDIPKWTQGPCQNAVRSHARMLSESRSICSQSAFWNVLRIHGWMHLGF